jgi:hypothetical protein
VHDGEQRYGAGRGLLLDAWWGTEGLQLAAASCVDDVPATLAKLSSDRVRGFKIALATALDALGKQPLCLGSIRSFLL